MPSVMSVVEATQEFSAQEAMDHSSALLKTVAVNTGREPLVRVYTPQPTLAFSRRESLMHGFVGAAQKARDAGFSPVIRVTGGRAVAYDTGSLVFDVAFAEPPHRMSSDYVFERCSIALVELLGSLGVRAQIGQIPGEYCPGKFSINRDGREKLVGTAQRVVRGARLISGFLHFGPVQEIRDVLLAVNARLNLAWNPETVGSLGGFGGLTPATFADSLDVALREFARGLVEEAFR